MIETFDYLMIRGLSYFYVDLMVSKKIFQFVSTIFKHGGSMVLQSQTLGCPCWVMTRESFESDYIVCTVPCEPHKWIVSQTKLGATNLRTKSPFRRWTICSLFVPFEQICRPVFRNPNFGIIHLCTLNGTHLFFRPLVDIILSYGKEIILYSIIGGQGG